jgi:hypothetical protein
MHRAQLFTLVLVAVAAAAGGYRYSLWRHPTRKCHGCGGTGRHKAGLFRYAGGECVTRTVIGPRAQCQNGRVPRWGVRLFKIQPLRKRR